MAYLCRLWMPWLVILEHLVKSSHSSASRPTFLRVTSVIFWQCARLSCLSWVRLCRDVNPWSSTSVLSSTSLVRFAKSCTNVWILLQCCNTETLSTFHWLPAVHCRRAIQTLGRSVTLGMKENGSSLYKDTSQGAWHQRHCAKNKLMNSMTLGSM